MREVFLNFASLFKLIVEMDRYLFQLSLVIRWHKRTQYNQANHKLRAFFYPHIRRLTYA